MVNSLQMSKHALVCFQWHSTFYSYLHTSISTLSNKENIYVHLFFTNDSVTEVAAVLQAAATSDRLLALIQLADMKA